MVFDVDEEIAYRTFFCYMAKHGGSQVIISEISNKKRFRYENAPKMSEKPCVKAVAFKVEKLSERKQGDRRAHV